MQPTSFATGSLRAFPTLLLPLFLSAAPAQTPDHLIGITRNAPFLRHVDQPGCALIGQCALPGMPPATPLPPFVGGTAWDPKTSGAWVSNGVLLGKYADNCIVQCGPSVIPTLPANAFVTGIEVVTGRDELWLLDSQGNLHFYTNTCPPVSIGGCNTGLLPVANQVTTALCVDEGRGIV